MTRPSPQIALREALQHGEPEVLVKVVCRDCRRTPGRVVATERGPLWLGYLRNPAGRDVHGGETYIVLWLDPSAFVLGECRCVVDTGIREEGWPARSARSHRISTDALRDSVNARRRVLPL